MKKLFAQIKENFDSVFFTFQLIAALVATVVTGYAEIPFIDRESLILYLLILIAFDLYYIAVHRIDKIIEKVQRPVKGLDEYLLERDASGTLDSFLRTTKKSIFISGSTMVSLRISAGLLKEKLQSGVQINILLWDLCNEVEANALTAFDESSCMDLANQIKGSLAFLWPIQKEFPNLKIGFLKTVILTDYVGVDLRSADGVIKVQFRLYQETSDKFINCIIKSKEAPKSFKKYRKQIDCIWKDAVLLDDAYLKKFAEKFGEIK